MSIRVKIPEPLIDTQEVNSIKFFSTELPEIIDVSLISSVKDSLQGLKDTLEPILDTVSGALTVAGAVLVDVADPLAAIIDALLEELNDLIASLIDTGLSVAYVFPSLGNLYSLEDCYSLLANSCLDPFDDERPITSSGTETPFTAVVIGSRMFSVDAFGEILLRLQSFLSIDPFIDLFNDLEFGSTVTDPPYGESEKPDWQSGNLVDIIPPVGDALRSIQSVLISITPNPSFSEVIQDLIDIIEVKKLELERLLDLLDDALNAFINLQGLSFDVAIIKGQGDQNTLAQAFTQARNLIPNSLNSVEIELLDETDTDRDTITDLSDNIGFAIALVATGVDNADNLLYLMGV